MNITIETQVEVNVTFGILKPPMQGAALNIYFRNERYKHDAYVTSSGGGQLQVNICDEFDDVGFITLNAENKEEERLLQLMPLYSRDKELVIIRLFDFKLISTFDNETHKKNY